MVWRLKPMGVADVKHQCEQDQAGESDDGDVHGSFRLVNGCCLIGRLREQARSHNGSRLDMNFMFTGELCGSEPAREGANSVSL